MLEIACLPQSCAWDCWGIQRARVVFCSSLPPSAVMYDKTRVFQGPSYQLQSNPPFLNQHISDSVALFMLLAANWLSEAGLPLVSSEEHLKKNLFQSKAWRMLHLQVPAVLSYSLLKAVPGLILGTCDHFRAIGPGWGTSASLPWKT